MIRSRTNLLLVAFSSVFAVGMLILMFSAVDKAQLIKIISELRPFQLFVAFGLFLLAIFLRGIRFRFMMNATGGYFVWCRIAALHQFFFSIIPFRLGELSFFPLASKLSDGEFKSSLPVLLNSRLYDFLMLALLATVAVLGLQIPGYTAVFVLIAVVLFLVAANTKYLFVVSEWIFEKLHVSYKLEAFRKFGQHLGEARAWYRVNERSRYAIMAITLLSWLAEALGFYFIFKSLLIDLGAYQVLFLFAGMTFIAVVGFFSVGGIGVSELGLAGLLMVLGFDAHYALAIGILTRLTMLGMTLAATLLMELVTCLKK